MTTAELHVVTGAFSYTGRYIARRLLAMDRRVKTLTGHPSNPNPFGDRVSAEPFNFDNPAALARSLEGVDTLYNTYWIRFPKGELTHMKAVENSKALIRAAEEAGVRRLVHISITNASADSPLPYFSGKALVEEAIKDSRLSYAMLRPTVAFGKEDILVNNIAWTLRKFPFFTMFGDGGYRIRPIYVDDLAELAVREGQQNDSVAFDAVGPETFTFEEMVRLIGEKIGKHRRIVHVRPGIAHFLSGIVGYLVRDVTLTRDEIDSLMANLLVSNAPPTGHTRLTHWLDDNAATLGTRYTSEVKRHYRGMSK
ncbi:MAG: NAD(P)H-binding protein [Chloroflexi bacterium]|nr:NAD(P)H-binding protein [Chloroflexota bacterium]